VHWPELRVAVEPASLQSKVVIRAAIELAQSAVERWNAGDLDAVYADWDPEIIVRPDSNFPDTGELFGVPAARRFWEDQREFMGAGRLEILEEHELGERCLVRDRQKVDAPASDVSSSYDWSFLTTARTGKIIRIEFFIDREQALAAAGVLRADS
jgi:ketosteroid isomerase-like protein